MCICKSTESENGEKKSENECEQHVNVFAQLHTYNHETFVLFLGLLLNPDFNLSLSSALLTALSVFMLHVCIRIFHVTLEIGGMSEIKCNGKELFFFLFFFSSDFLGYAYSCTKGGFFVILMIWAQFYCHFYATTDTEWDVVSYDNENEIFLSIFGWLKWKK